MKTKYWTAIVCLSLTSTLAAQEQTWTRDLEFDAMQGSGSLEFEAAVRGTVVVEVQEKPEGFTLRGKIDSADRWHSDALQYRVSPGKHTFTAFERWYKEYTGPVKLKVRFAADNEASEPTNDSLDTPRDIPLNELIEASIFPADEVDFLKVELPYRGYVWIDVPETPEGLVPWVEITDEFGTKLGINAVRTEFDGPLILKLADRWRKFGSTEPFKFRVNFAPETDVNEPNGTVQTAAPMELGTWRETVLAPGGDRDHFLVHIPHPGVIQVRVYDQPEWDLTWSLLDPETGKKVAGGWTMMVSKGGDYVLSLHERWGKQWSLNPFRFKLVWRASDKITPNDAESVTLVEPGQVYRTRIAVKREQDRLGVQVDKPSIVWFVAEGPQRVQPWFDVRGKNGSTVWVRSEPGEVEASLGYRFDSISFDPIYVWADVQPDIDPAEPNDTLEQRRPLVLGEQQQFYLYPWGDNDWFGFKLKAKSKVCVQVSSPIGALGELSDGFAVDLKKQDGSTITVQNGSGERSWTGAPVELETGTYYVRLSPGRNSFSTHPLNLVVYLEGEEPEAPNREKAVDSGVYLIGIELADGGENLRAMVEAEGGEFDNADSSQKIAKRLEKTMARFKRKPDVVEDNRAPVRTSRVQSKGNLDSSPLWIWLIILLVTTPALVLIVVWLKRRKRHDELDDGKKL